MTHPYSITGIVNGQRLIWPFATLSEVEKQWALFAPQRIVPGTQDRITDLTLMFGERRLVTLWNPETKKAPE